MLILPEFFAMSIDYPNTLHLVWLSKDILDMFACRLLALRLNVVGGS